MNCDLKALRESNRWKRDLYGFVLLEDKKLKDEQVRLIVEKGIENGYETLYDIPDEIAKQWLKNNQNSRVMTREQIEKKAKEIAANLGACPECVDMQGVAMKMAEWLLSHQWVSVEDELPPKKERYSKYVIMRGRFGIGGHYIGCYDFVAEKWLVRGDRGLEDTSMPVTHWMPVPPLAEEGGEK